ncbi:hypothetical protein Tco_0578605 [Tanacetum coccineum]
MSSNSTTESQHRKKKLLGATKDELISYLLASITARITEQVKSQLPQILPKEVSNFVPLVIKSMVTESLEHAILAKESSQPKSTYEAASSLIEFESKEPEFEVADFDMPQDQEENLGNDNEEPKRKVATKCDWFTKPEQLEDPTDLNWNVGKTPQQGPTQSYLKITNLTQETLLGPAFKLLKGTHTNYAELEYDLENVTKLYQIYLIGITRKVVIIHLILLNPSLYPVKVAYDKHALWGISYWRDQLNHVEVIRKHGYGYLRDIEVRRADNNLYTFKEGDFPRLRINDIEDVLILIV